MDTPLSKSQKKREADALQKIGTELSTLPVNLLDRIPLSDHLRQAIIDAKTITSHGAKRRQAQLIGKLMRSCDTQAIIAAYDDIKAEKNAGSILFHELEQWRTRLINEGKEALTEFISAHPGVDAQKLRHLIKKAVDEHQTDKPAGASKALFRFLRDCAE